MQATCKKWEGYSYLVTYIHYMIFGDNLKLYNEMEIIIYLRDNILTKLHEKQK